MRARLDEMKPLKIGMVNYINTSHLYIPWKELGPAPSLEMVEGTPSELNRLLARGELDVGLVSSFAYARDFRSYYILPELCISANGPVESVLLFSRIPAEKLDREEISLTPQSATSVNLLYIILEDFLGIRPRYARGEFRHLEEGRSQGYLAIGDEALRLARERPDLKSLDLARVWLEHTGLPFVFALWTLRKESFEKNREAFTLLRERLVQSYKMGINHLERISRQVADRIPMPPDACLRYLRGIELDFSMEKRWGLEEFFRRLYQRNTLAEKPELQFIPGPGTKIIQENIQ